jgi:uncharacterized protein
VSELSGYGPWAVVAGASEGIGAAFATALARGGLNIVIAARRPEPLEALASQLQADHGIRVRTVTGDLATVDGVGALVAACAEIEVGILVANAAFAPIGRFLERDEADLVRAVELNAITLVRLARRFLPAMVQRGRGGLVVMSSLAGHQGSPGIATYAATKAFGAVLAEGLWAELRGTGVDVVACVAGAVLTPGLAQAKQRRAPGTVGPDVVASAALDALGHGPRVVPGRLMRVSSVLTSRLMPKRAAIALIAKASADLT